MFSSNNISEILGIRDKNLKFTGKISNKIINGVKFNILHSTITYMVDYLTVYNDGKIEFTFLDGSQIELNR